MVKHFFDALYVALSGQTRFLVEWAAKKRPVPVLRGKNSGKPKSLDGRRV